MDGTNMVPFRTLVSWGGDGFNLAPGEMILLPQEIAQSRVDAGLGTIEDERDESKRKRKK